MQFKKSTSSLLFITIIVVILGSIMYNSVEETDLEISLLKSIYWAVVTITTVGYGDISPVTPLGKFILVILMLCGYSIIAVPTGSCNILNENTSYQRKKICNRCGNIENDDDARYCKECGEK